MLNIRHEESIWSRCDIQGHQGQIAVSGAVCRSQDKASQLWAVSNWSDQWEWIRLLMDRWQSDIRGLPGQPVVRTSSATKSNEQITNLHILCLKMTHLLGHLSVLLIVPILLTCKGSFCRVFASAQCCRVTWSQDTWTQQVREEGAEQSGTYWTYRRQKTKSFHARIDLIPIPALV